jgi:hypothetical protein
MELTDKILINNENQVKAIIMAWDMDKFYHYLQIKDFKQYPAILSYYIDDNDYSMNYSATVYYSITYLSDFEEL